MSHHHLPHPQNDMVLQTAPLYRLFLISYKHVRGYRSIYENLKIYFLTYEDVLKFKQGLIPKFRRSFFATTVTTFSRDCLEAAMRNHLVFRSTR